MFEVNYCTVGRRICAIISAIVIDPKYCYMTLSVTFSLKTLKEERVEATRTTC